MNHQGGSPELDRLRHRRRAAAVGGLALAAAIAMVFVPRIPQAASYHNFADKRPWLGVPNFGDVASNAPFSIVGLVALAWLAARRRIGPGQTFLTRAERLAWIAVFAGVFLTGFGSAYYHWRPDTPRLFWDRLPMTIAFMSLLAVQIMERIDVRAGAALLVPLLAIGACSVVFWHLGEFRGKGDLRLYALVQFYPMLAIPLMLFLFPARYDRTADLLFAFGWYVLAKVNEQLDVNVFEWLGYVVSGHTLKHLCAAAGMAQILRMLVKRKPVVELREAEPRLTTRAEASN